MKAKMNGIEVEGTTDEIIALLKGFKSELVYQLAPPQPKEETTIKKEQPIEELQEEDKDISQQKHKRRSKQEQRRDAETVASAIAEGKYRNINEAQSNLFGTHYVHDYEMIKKLLKAKGISYTGWAGNRKPILKSIDSFSKARERSKFVYSRANSLMKNSTMSREAAMAQAAQEWNVAHGIMPKGTHKKWKVQMPKAALSSIPQIVEDSMQNEALLNLLHHVIANSGTLKLFPDGQMMGIDSGRDWHELVLKIMQKFSEIANYFGKENKFLLEKNSEGYEYIKYNGGLK